MVDVRTTLRRFDDVRLERRHAFRLPNPWRQTLTEYGETLAPSLGNPFFRAARRVLRSRTLVFRRSMDATGRPMKL